MNGTLRLSCRSPPLPVCPVLLLLLPSSRSPSVSCLSCLCLSLPLNFISVLFSLSLCLSPCLSSLSLCLSHPPSGALRWADLRSCPRLCFFFFLQGSRGGEKPQMVGGGSHHLHPLPGPASCKTHINNGKLVEALPAPWHTALAIGSVWGAEASLS